jgi:glucan 1,3-beta-glucosidase
VTEPFINPSIYMNAGSPIDEFHLCQTLGPIQAKQVLEQHWDTWYSEADFQQIANYGLNHVRIPIGYWAFQLVDGDPYVQGQEAYLDRAIGWARQAGLKVWVDLHGAPGSQNGFDNSGQRDVLQWQADNNVNMTLTTLEYMAKKYGAFEYNDVVVAIELLNEPLGPVLNMDQVSEYWRNGWQVVRNSGSDTGVTIHDAFMPIGYWNGFMAMPNYWNVILDHHEYQVFSAGELLRTLDQHIQYACSLGQQMRGETLWRVVGEWSAALTDCTPWLNGVGRGARYEGQLDNSPYIGSCQGINDINTWSQQKLVDTRRWIEAQMDAYDQGNGWIFWTYKTENSLEWDMGRLIKAGLFPIPLTDRHYPNQCGY